MSEPSASEQVTASTSAERRSGARVVAIGNPLAPSTYLLRNLGKTLPLIGVILLAVMLIAGIVSMIDSIPLSIRTIYGYSRFFLAVSPRGDPTLPKKVIKQIESGTPVPIGRVVLCRASGAQVMSLVGKWPFTVLGLTHDDMRYFLKRIGVSDADIHGRLPVEAAPEAVVSRPVAKNLGLKLGSTLLSPQDKDNYSPLAVKVVGIVDTPEWLMLDDVVYQRLHHLWPTDGVLVFARNLRDQDKLDRWAFNALKGRRALPIAYFDLERETNETFSILYRILDVVIATLVIVLAVMMGMLMNIYQSQRIIEYGLLQAIGYTRRRLMARALTETATVLVLGWMLGLGAASLLLRVVDALIMEPHAFVISIFDANAVGYTATVPIAILAVASATVALRFRRFDPVSIVERRLV
jgi:putative ABC transport system permease protein/lipoprotein-releasing system permease protein